MENGDGFGRRLLVSVDAKSYGSGDDQRQAAIQQGLLKVLDEAAAGAHLTRSEWIRQGAGDGELAVLPEGESEPRLVDDFVRKLHAALVRHNHDLKDEAWLRLRLAVHYGVAMPASNGFSGQGVVVVSRLADGRPLRAALAASGGPLAVALSGRIYDETVAQRHTTLAPADFRKVRVRNKEFEQSAWLWVPGADVHTLDLGEDGHVGDGGAPGDGDGGGERSAPGGGAAPPAAGVSNQFHGPVHAQGSTFGNRYR